MSNQLYFIIEYPSQSLGTSEKTKLAFTLSPNPVNSQLTISFPEQEAIFIFTDLSGKKVLVSEAVSGVHVVDVSNLAPGTYLVQAGQTIQKLVIE